MCTDLNEAFIDYHAYNQIWYDIMTCIISGINTGNNEFSFEVKSGDNIYYIICEYNPDNNPSVIEDIIRDGNYRLNIKGNLLDISLKKLVLERFVPNDYLYFEDVLISEDLSEYAFKSFIENTEDYLFYIIFKVIDNQTQSYQYFIIYGYDRLYALNKYNWLRKHLEKICNIEYVYGLMNQRFQSIDYSQLNIVREKNNDIPEYKGIDSVYELIAYLNEKDADVLLTYQNKIKNLINEFNSNI